MAKWTLPEGKIYTQADLDQRIAAVLIEAAEQAASVRWTDDTCGKTAAMAEKAILALIDHDAGAALDRALAAQRERDAKVAETHPMRFAGQTEDDVRAALAAAIRAQGD